MSDVLDHIRENGYVDLGEVDPCQSIEIVSSRVAASVGAMIVAPPELLGTSSVGSKSMNTYGGNYGLGDLPVLTDLAHWYIPPRYVMLRCIVGSSLVDTRIVHRKELEHHVPRALMERALFRPRRRLEGKMYLLKMLTDGILRWDELFLEPDNSTAREVCQLMARMSLNLCHTSVVLDRPGRTVVIDNWNALHGRSEVPSSVTRRLIERVYLEEAKNDR